MALASGVLAEDAKRDAPSWVPKGWEIAEDSISPDRRFAVIEVDKDGDPAPSKLVELKTGRTVATLVGACGGQRSHWEASKAGWSDDGSTLIWITTGKWFPRSYVILKLRDGKLVWQIDIMSAVETELLTRTQEAAPLNFAAAKLRGAGGGSVYPEGFLFDIDEAEAGFRLPLVCAASMRTVTVHADEDEPWENEVRSSITMTLTKDGELHYSGFELDLNKRDHVTKEMVQKVKEAAKKSYSLFDTDLGKALVIPETTSKDGRYAIGWTVRPVAPNTKPVDWKRWDVHDPAKLLRHYDWQTYDPQVRPYEAVDFVVDLRKGKTVELPTKSPYWPWKGDDWKMNVVWLPTSGGLQFALVENGVLVLTEDLWLVGIEKKGFQRTILTSSMKTAVHELLRKLRPMVASSDYESLRFQIEAIKRRDGGFVKVPFIYTYPVSNKRQFGLQGEVTVNLATGEVTGASSDSKPIDPFLNNEELKKADEKLNALYTAALAATPPAKIQEFKQAQRAWIKKRDEDADRAVNSVPYTATAEACEQAWEKSLIESTTQRINELQSMTEKARSAK
jgi:uncharacterized protein YecT (DUF1311 family)